MSDGIRKEGKEPETDFYGSLPVRDSAGKEMFCISPVRQPVTGTYPVEYWITRGADDKYEGEGMVISGDVLVRLIGEFYAANF